MREKIIFSWSGGKDSAFALHEILKNRDYEIAACMTTITDGYDRISMHGVRRSLLEKQVASLGIPLDAVIVPKDSTSEVYDALMRESLNKYIDTGVNKVAFGDIFLEDLRKYREGNLSKVGMRAVFPIWKRDTQNIAREFIKEGFKSIITCIDTKALDRSFVGRNFDDAFLDELPKCVDFCGENGEFHSFVYAGPIFRKEVPHTTGEIVLRNDRFYYCDVI